MGWFTGIEHITKGGDEYKSILGKTPTDTYHTNSSDKRDWPHSTDLKVFDPKHEPLMADVVYSKK